MNRLHSETMGQGPPLVLLHGWGWHSGIWQPLLPELAKYYQITMIDLPGCGHSVLLSDSYNLEILATQLLQVAPPLATWLGWSLGGLIAMWMALHYPARVNKLI